jgi:diguanylate cyclase (GGDEF)-like protein
LVDKGISSADALLQALGIDDTEIAERQAFLELTDADVVLLADLHDRIERAGECDFFLDAFYEHLLAFENMRVQLRDEETLKRLKQAQSEYFHSLTSGDYGSDYVLNRLRVGVAHQRVGLAPKWYIGAYCKYLSLLIPKIDDLIEDPATARRTVLALLKIMLFDTTLAIDTYIHAEQRAIQRKSAQLGALNQIALALTSSLSLDEISYQIMREGIALSGSSAAHIAFYDPADQTFRAWRTQGLSQHFVENVAFRHGGLADEALTANTYILSNDRPGTSHPLSKLTREEGIRCLICLPFASHADKLGVVYFYRKDRDSFDPEEIELLVTFARLAAQAVENARLHARVDQEARVDALTGLLNRRAFDRCLDDEQKRAQRYDKPYALMMIDIDHFKNVNDSYGHPAGDAVLKALGRMLIEQCRDVDIVARYGGEEFAVILPQISGGAAKSVAERVRHTVAGTPFKLPDGREIGVSVTIGISCYPNCAVDGPAAVSTADQAMYVAKEAGRNRVLLYRETLKARLEKDPNLIVTLLNENLDTLQSISTAISTKTSFLRKHGAKVLKLTQRLVTAFNLSPEERDALYRGALLHDIGMVAIPDAVLAKTVPLTVEESAILKRHPVIGAELIERVPALHHFAPLVRHHHEHYDGSGYPDGLSGAAIPLLARVFALADAYVSMVLGEPGRTTMTPTQAREALKAGAGTQFDPELVQLLLASWEENPD